MLWPCGPGRLASRNGARTGPALRLDRREAGHARVLDEAQYRAVDRPAWDQGKGLLPEPFGSPGATALQGSDDCLKQLGVPDGGLGGYFLDKPGKLAAIRQQRRGAVSTPATGSACGRGRPGGSGAGRLIDVAMV